MVGLAAAGTRCVLGNIAVVASNRDESSLALLRAYLDAVTLSEPLQTRLWHAAQLTLAQVRALRKLAREPRPLGQLGSELALSAPSMTRLVDRLEERGLIERRRSEDDRRKVVAVLTARGRSLVQAVPLFEDTAIRTAVERMTPADRERIASALREFNRAVREVEDESLVVGARA
jgi:DNA-binding MarR family transcriptional regulator